MPPADAIAFLIGFEEKDAYTDEVKAIAAGLRAQFCLKVEGGIDLDQCS